MLKYLIAFFLILAANTEFQPSAAQNKNTQIRMPCGSGIVNYEHQSQYLVTNISAKSSFVRHVNVGPKGPQSGQLGLTFVGHSTFLIQSPENIRVITDYNDYFRADVQPDIVTMDVKGGSHSTNLIPNIFTFTRMDRGSYPSEARCHPEGRPGL